MSLARVLPIAAWFAAVGLGACTTSSPAELEPPALPCGKCDDFGSAAWTQPARVSDFNSGSAMSPQIAISPQGTPIVVWQEQDAIGFELFASTFDAAVADWTQPARVSDFNSKSAMSPQIAITHEGTPIVIWQEQDAIGFELFASTFDAAVADWTQPTRVSDFNSKSAMSPQIAITPAGTPIVVWQEQDAIGFELFASMFDAAAADWTQPARVSHFNSESAMSPQIAITPDGTPIVVWQEQDAIGFELFASTFDAAAADWTQPAKVSHFNSESAMSPQIANTPSGTPIVVRQVQDAIGFELFASTFDDAAADWTQPARVSHFNSDSAMSPQIAIT
ncbi:MAG: hypothetical protein AB7P03_30200, partial [Kofleriaceae bacterium]